MANEKRLIDANALDEKLENLKVRFKAQCRNSVAEDYNFVQTVLLTAPTVDAVEVVHGWWVPDLHHSNGQPYKDEWYGYIFKCSVCGGTTMGYYDLHCDVNYCPNCGAKMDGDGNG